MRHQQTYSEDAVQQILRRALAAQAKESFAAQSPPPAVTDAQLACMAEELSISSGTLAIAKHEWNQQQKISEVQSARRKALLRNAVAFIGYNGLVFLLGHPTDFYLQHPKAAWIPMLWGLGLLVQVVRLWWPMEPAADETEPEEFRKIPVSR